MIRLSMKKIGHVLKRDNTMKALYWGRQPFVLYGFQPAEPQLRAFSMDRTPYDNKGVICPCVEEKRSPRFKGHGCVSLSRQTINRSSIIDDNRLSGSYNHYLINEALTLKTGNHFSKPDRVRSIDKSSSMTWPLYCLTIHKGEI